MAIYLDHNATTPLGPEVLGAMAAALRDLSGNPSSPHAAGRAARAAIERARAEVAALIGATAEEIVFTSGGTEGNALAIRGLLRGARARRGHARPHVVSSPIEHPSVLGLLADVDVELTLLPVGGDGTIDPTALRAALRPETVLVTLALANHELGNVCDVATLAAIAHEGGALFHADAVQAAGKVPVDVGALAVDALTISAHKIHGPKGVGAIFLRRTAPFEPSSQGGHQERERRAGTENVAGIVGFGVAARLARAELAETSTRIATLRERLERRLLTIDGARRHGHPTRGLPGTLNIGFLGAPGQLVAAALDLEGVAVSTGAACTSGSLDPSPVLLALGLSRDDAACALRFGLGRGTTAEEIDRVAALTAEIVARVRRRGQGDVVVTSAARERILIAMSGGVDSSTAAAVLVDAGYDVVGVTLRLYDASGTAASIGGRCCGPRDIEDARATAAHLGIPHHVIDESAAFSAAVIDDFVAEYRAGRTPNPCVRCNERIKFGPLLAFADAVGAGLLATGHYARLSRGGDGVGVALARARDADKDQSYFLFGLRPEVLARVRFPLGDLDKDEVRARARQRGLPNADKPDSQQICFIPDGDHVAFVTARGGAGPAGAIVDDATGVPLGAHAGTHGFTVGQRRGLPAVGERRFVLRIDAATGEVRVGPRERLGRDRLRVSDVRWLDPRASGTSRRCGVQIRHHAAAAPAWIEPTDDGATLVRLDQPAFGVAPGQAAVFYDGDDRVLGGGWIEAG
ncbi:MAG TPA: tRNA 2-thiouridine(34) synthase MnmA [Polyangia bacterium]|jgi:tRNA (5-methylaminomethyl-2-thiouridylate)-methyltransferase|nr:tRNA 2-thiouridine(34) synthase MnmA [Polyangia bacterium]